MLLDESRMRIELLGDWISPLVRQETKWRYNVYKDWLNILEEGSGNAFDVVEESLEAGEDNDLDYEFRGPSRREMRQTKPSKPAKSFVPPSVARDPPARVRVPIDEARSTSDSFSKAARRTLRTDSDMFPSRANNPVRKSRNAKAYERYIRRRMLEDNVPWSDIDEEEKKIEEENKRIYEQPTDKDRWFGDDEQEKSLNQQEVRSTYRDIPSRNSKIGRGTRNQWVDGSPSSRRPDVLRPKVRIFPMETAVRSDQPPLDEVEDTNAWTISATRRPIEPKGVYSMNKREVKTEDMSPSFPSTREYEDSDDV